MKHTKRILALLLVSALLLASCPLFASAATVYVSDVIGSVVIYADTGNYTMNGILVDILGNSCVLTAGWIVNEDYKYAFYNKDFNGNTLEIWDYAEDGSYALFTFADGSTADKRLYISRCSESAPGDAVTVYYYDRSGIEYIKDLGNAVLKKDTNSINSKYGSCYFLDHSTPGGDDCYGALVSSGSDPKGMLFGWADNEIIGEDLRSDVFLSLKGIADNYEGAGSYSMGDVDFDGSVTASDARLILRYAVNLEKFNEAQLLLADLDGIDGVTAADARLALRTAVGLESLRSYGDPIPGTTPEPQPKASYQNEYFSLNLPEKWGNNYKVNKGTGNFTEYKICNRYDEPLFMLSVIAPGAESIYTSNMIGHLMRGDQVVYNLFLRRPSDLPALPEHYDEYVSMLKDVEFTRDVAALIGDGASYSFKPVIDENVTDWIGRPFSDVIAAFGSDFSVKAGDTACYLNAGGEECVPLYFVTEQRINNATHANNHVTGLFVRGDMEFGNGLSAYMAYPDLQRALNGIVTVKEPTYSEKGNISTTTFRLNGFYYTYVWNDVTYNRTAAMYVLISS